MRYINLRFTYLLTYLHSGHGTTCSGSNAHIIAHIVKLLIEAPNFYYNKVLLPPACIRDPAFTGDRLLLKHCQLAIPG